MDRAQEQDMHYFVEIDLDKLTVIRCGCDQEEDFDKSRKANPMTHRLFVTKSEYHELISRCAGTISGCY